MNQEHFYEELHPHYHTLMDTFPEMEIVHREHHTNLED